MPVTLSSDQRRRRTRCAATSRERVFAVSLLDGVTGSGKTEVYFEAMAEALRSGKQTLILLPEIALTVQFLERFAERFGCRPAEWHSDLSQKERTRTLSRRDDRRGARRGRVRAPRCSCRSANSASSSSMRSTNRPTSRKTASSITRATWRWCGRGSRTARWFWPAPRRRSKSYVNATSGRYAHLRLSDRHGVAVMPQTKLIDLREAKSETRKLAVPAFARGAGGDARRGRTGDAVPQPPRLCAAHAVPESAATR